MNKLTISEVEGQLVTDSREVALMVGKEHKNLLRDIKGYEVILQGSTLSSENFFIESKYFNARNQEQPLYLLTKKGCDMVANKMTGEKGILFTAQYVTDFEIMENKINPKTQLSKEFQALFILDERTTETIKRIDTLENDMPLFNVECKELQALVRKTGIKALGGYKTPAYKDNSIRGKLYADIQRQIKREFNVIRYEGIKHSQLKIANEIIAGYRVPLYLEDEISLLNNQIRICE